MALVNSLYGGVCYSSIADAQNAYFSAQPVVRTAGTTSYESYYSNVAGVWKLTLNSYNSTGVKTQVYSVNATPPAFAPCDPLGTFNDGFALGWAIVAAWAVAFGVIFIRNAIQMRTE